MSVTMVIVDDDPGFRRAAAAMFASLSVDVIEQTVDGATGVEAIRRHLPDWVLLDVNLPDMDGVTVSRVLRDEGLPSKVLLTSSGQSLWSGAELMEAGVRLYVEKDRLFEPDVVALVLDRQDG